jgi:hypothetical protein
MRKRGSLQVCYVQGSISPPNSSYQDSPRSNERTYRGLQNKPGAKPFGQVFIKILRREHGVIVGGSSDITKSSRGFSSYFESLGGISDICRSIKQVTFNI